MNKIFTLPTYFGMIVIVIMALLTGFDVVGRYVFNSPIPGTFELTEALMSIVVASGIAKATQMGEHISVDALYVKLSAPTQRWLTLTERIIGLLFFGVLTIKGIQIAFDSYWSEETTTLLKVPLYIFKLILATGFFISFCIIARRLFFLANVESHKLNSH